MMLHHAPSAWQSPEIGWCQLVGRTLPSRRSLQAAHSRLGVYMCGLRCEGFENT